MSNVDMHQVNFEWPYTNPKTVIVTGTFDQWKSTCHLTRTPSGFAGSIRIPWNQMILYKFIVDGNWVLRYDQPTETEGRTGYVNHVYTAPPRPVLYLESSESPEPVIADAGKHKGHTKVGVNGHSGVISNGITAEAPERRVQLIAVPSSDKFDRPGGGETVPNMSAPPNDSDAAVLPPHPVEESQKKSPFAPILPIMIIPVNTQENSSVPSSSPPAGDLVVAPPAADVVSKASEEPAKDVVVKADQPSTHSPIPVVSEIKSGPAVQEKSEPKPAEVSEPVTDKGSKVDEPKAVTAVEDKHAETSNKEEPASASTNGVSITPSPEKTNDIPKRTPPPLPPPKAHVFPTSGSPPSSPSSSRFNSTRRSVKKRTLTIIRRVKEVFKSDKEKAKDKTM